MSPRTIAIVSQKGGSGKTTTALNLAIAAQRAGKSVVLVDLDPQASATAWYRARVDKTLVVQPTHPAGLKDLKDVAKSKRVDWLILDTAAQTDSIAAHAIEASDLVLIPCRPSVMDLRAIPNSVRLCRMYKSTPHIVLTQIEAQGTLQDEARKNLSALGVDVLPGGLGRRAAFHHSLIDGRTALEYEPHGKAALEVLALYETVSHLAIKPSRARRNKEAQA